MLCDGMVHHIRRVRVRVRVRVRAEIRVKSRPTTLTFSRSSGYAYVSPINSFVTVHYAVRVEIRSRVPLKGPILRSR